MKKYRFDNAYEKVYELIDNAYVCIGSYYKYKIKKSDSYCSKASKNTRQQEGKLIMYIPILLNYLLLQSALFIVFSIVVIINN